jgi:probable phosphoglycerate mutase
VTLLYLVRHGRSTWNAEGRIQGHADPPLDDLGRRQAQALAARLQTENIHAVYSSPLLRASQTAEILCAVHGWPLWLDPRLMERYTGEWTGLMGSEVDEWMAANPGYDFRVLGPPGGESTAALMARAAEVFAEIVAAHPGQRVAVVSHGGTLGAYLRHMLGIAAEQPVHFRFGNTGLARLSLRDGQVRLLSLGDERHAERLE